MTNSVTGSNNIQIVAKGDVNIGTNGSKPAPSPKQTNKVISDEQCHVINAIADGFGLLHAELFTDNVAALLKHIAYKAGGVRSVRTIPADKYMDALHAMREYIHKHSKSD